MITYEEINKITGGGLATFMSDAPTVIEVMGAEYAIDTAHRVFGYHAEECAKETGLKYADIYNVIKEKFIDVLKKENLL